MRHRISHRKLNRTSAHRRALRRNLTQSLIQYGQIRTTLVKAKDLRPFAERLITLAIKSRAGSLTARRQIHHLLGDRSLIAADHQETYDQMSNAKRRQVLRAPSGRRYRTGQPKGKLSFTGESVIHRLIEEVAPRFEGRNGGYTRIIRLSDRRIGDHSPLAMVQLLGDETGPGPITKPGKNARRKRADARYAFAIKALKAAGKTAAEASKKQAESAAESQPQADSAEPAENAE